MNGIHFCSQSYSNPATTHSHAALAQHSHSHSQHSILLECLRFIFFFYIHVFILLTTLLFFPSLRCIARTMCVCFFFFSMGEGEKILSQCIFYILLWKSFIVDFILCARFEKEINAHIIMLRYVICVWLLLCCVLCVNIFAYTHESIFS